MATIDTNRVPSGERAAAALVAAIVGGDDRLERHYLEVKSGLDLTTKKDQAKLAKFILGAANRMPDKAAVAFEGYGVMVVGVSKGAAVGVAPIEVLTIEKAVQPFIGADGPKWDIVRVAVPDSDNDVLLLLVDPPKWGQPPFVCLKSGEEKLRDGGIFIRADGETREAKGDELKELLRRGSVNGAPSTKFDVELIGAVTPVLLDKARTLDEYISKKRRALLDALDAAKPQEESKATAEATKADRSPASTALSIGKGFNSIFRATIKPEERSEEGYKASIDKWEARAREAWPTAVMQLVGGLLPEVQIEITNGKKAYFAGVEVTVHLDGEVFGADRVSLPDEPTLADLEFPLPPRLWGPVRVDAFATANYLTGMNTNLFSPSTFTPHISRSGWRNSGSVDLDFGVGELRPLASDTTDDLDVVLFVCDESIKSIHGTWQITAKDHNDIYTGELDIELAEPLDLTAEFRKLMGLDA